MSAKALMAKQFTLYHTHDARSFRALWTMSELGFADKLNLITMHFPPRVFYRPYMKINPLGTIPYFIDVEGDVRMTESCAIPQYLVTKYGPTPLCVTPEEADYGPYLNWLFHADATLTFPQTVVLRYTQQEPGRADQAAEDYGNWYIARLKMLDNTLADGREFLVGGRFTIADIVITYALSLGCGFGFDTRYKPQTLAYMERMKARPSFAQAQQMQGASHAAFTAEHGEPQMPEPRPKTKSNL